MKKQRALRCGIAALLAVTTILALAACSQARTQLSESVPGADPTHGSVVEVRDGSVTPVLSLAASVQSGVRFQVTAPVAGIVQRTAHGGIAIATGSGTQHVDLPPGVKDLAMLVEPGTRVPTGLPVASATFAGFAVVAPVEGEDLLRFTVLPVSARAQIDGSGAPFRCRFLNPLPTFAAQAGPSSPETIGCVVPFDEKVIDGFAGIIAIRFPGKTNVPILPIDAIAGSIGSGAVYLVKGDTTVYTKVGLGLSDGIDVEITSGLKPGDRVRIPGPSLLTQR